MKAHQLHYTSCKRGRGGSAGFQFRTYSRELAQDELQKIGELGNYQVSRDLDREAPAEDIARFPVLFRYSLLDDGTRLLIRSRYTGMDYSGRSGNFFAHTLLLPEDSLDFWPIDLNDWDGWKHMLSGAEDSVELPPLLDSVDIDVDSSVAFDFDQLESFLEEDPARVELLEKMIRAAFARKDSSRSVVIRDRFFDGLFWIACIQKSFPPQCVTELTFSTYQHQSRNCEAVNVSVGDTDFLFDDNEMKFEFFCFDMVDGRFSDVPDEHADYAETISQWMASDVDALQEFYTYMESFDCRDLDDGLDQALLLFKTNNDLVPLPDGKQLTDLLKFASGHMSPDERSLMAERLLTQIENIDSDALGAVVVFLAAVAKNTDAEKYRTNAFKSWIKMFDRVIVEGRRVEESVATTESNVLRQLSGHRKEMAELFLDQGHLDWIGSQFRRQPPQVLMHILTTAIDALSAIGKAGQWYTHPAASFLTGLTISAEQPAAYMNRLLDVASGTAATTGAACRYLGEGILADVESEDMQHEVLQTLGRVIGKQLIDMRPEDALIVRRSLDEPQLYPILCGEWLLHVSTDVGAATQRQKVFANYSKSVLDKLPGYGQIYRAWVMQAYWDSLPPAGRANQALYWLRSEELALLDDVGLVTSAVNIIYDGLPSRLRGERQKKDAALLQDIAHQFNLKLETNRVLKLDDEDEIEPGNDSRRKHSQPDELTRQLTGANRPQDDKDDSLSKRVFGGIRRAFGRRDPDGEK